MGDEALQCFAAIDALFAAIGALLASIGELVALNGDHIAQMSAQLTIALGASKQS